MGFIKNVMVFGLLMANLGGRGSPAPAEPSTASWRAVAEGVYEKSEPDGATARLTFGAAGAEHVRQALELRVEQAEADARMHPRDGAAAERLEVFRRALGVAAQGAKSGGATLVTQEMVPSGFLCGAYRYELETGRLREPGKVSFAARVAFNPNPNVFSPAPPVPAGVSFVATAAIQAAPSRPETVSQGYNDHDRTIPVELSAIDTLDQGKHATSSCTGFTSSQIFVASPICPGGGSYVALERVYRGC